jgi:hypothetical protein
MKHKFAMRERFEKIMNDKICRVAQAWYTKNRKSFPQKGDRFYLVARIVCQSITEQTTSPREFKSRKKGIWKERKWPLLNNTQR